MKKIQYSSTNTFTQYHSQHNQENRSENQYTNLFQNRELHPNSKLQYNKEYRHLSSNSISKKLIPYANQTFNNKLTLNIDKLNHSNHIYCKRAYEILNIAVYQQVTIEEILKKFLGALEQKNELRSCSFIGGVVHYIIDPKLKPKGINDYDILITVASVAAVKSARDILRQLLGQLDPSFRSYFLQTQLVESDSENAWALLSLNKLELKISHANSRNYRTSMCSLRFDILQGNIIHPEESELLPIIEDLKNGIFEVNNRDSGFNRNEFLHILELISRGYTQAVRICENERPRT